MSEHHNLSCWFLEWFSKFSQSKYYLKNSNCMFHCISKKKAFKTAYIVILAIDFYIIMLKIAWTPWRND